LSLVSRPGDLDGEGVEIREGRVLADANGDSDHLGVLQDGGRDPLGDRLEQVGRRAFEDLPGGFLEEWVADGVLGRSVAAAFRVSMVTSRSAVKTWPSFRSAGLLPW
jgi:hypothetical protein